MEKSGALAASPSLHMSWTSFEMLSNTLVLLGFNGYAADYTGKKLVKRRWK